MAKQTPLRNFPISLIELTLKLSRDKEQKTIPQLLLKTGEELGEMYQAYLSMTGAPANTWRGKTSTDFHEEQVDVLLCIIATMAKSGMTQELFEQLMRKKTKAWEAKLAGTYKKPKKKVFVLYDDNPRDGSLGVYSTRAAAQAAGKKYWEEELKTHPAWKDCWPDYTIEERDVED